jgi:hypothetical protein
MIYAIVSLGVLTNWVMLYRASSLEALSEVLIACRFRLFRFYFPCSFGFRGGDECNESEKELMECFPAAVRELSFLLKCFRLECFEHARTFYFGNT